MHATPDCDKALAPITWAENGVLLVAARLVAARPKADQQRLSKLGCMDRRDAQVKNMLGLTSCAQVPNSSFWANRSKR